MGIGLKRNRRISLRYISMYIASMFIVIRCIDQAKAYTLIRPRLESLRFSRLQMLNLMLGRSSRCDNCRWKLWCRIGTIGKVVWRSTCGQALSIS